MMEAQKQISKLSLIQQTQLLDLYDDAIAGVAQRVAKTGSLTERARDDYIKELTRTRKLLAEDVNNLINKGVIKAAEIGARTTIDVLKIERFTPMFSTVRDDVVKSIISGGLYTDNKTLSDRIWNYSKDFQNDLQYTINQGILQKKSAIELAKDLEKFVLDPAKRPADWGKVYPGMKYKKVDYNAQRLARTSINHSFQTSTIEASRLNPYVDGIQWHSAQQHGRTCDICMDRDGEIYTFDDVPLDHPNGLCTMIPVVSKPSGEIADELRRWLDGEPNPELDRLMEV